MAVKSWKDVKDTKNTVSKVKSARDVLESLPSTGRTGDEYQQYAEAMKSSRLQEVSNNTSSSRDSKNFIENIDPVKKLLTTKKEEKKKPGTRLENPTTSITKWKDMKDSFDTMASNSTRSAMAAQAADKEKFNAETGRNLPVIGTALRGLDKFAEVTKPFADVAQELYTPGGGLSAVNAATKGAGALISRIAPSLGNGSGLLPRVTTRALEEAITGVPLGVGNVLARNPEASNKEIAEGAKYGGGGGAVLGGLGPVVGAVGKKVVKTAREVFGGSRSGAIESVVRDVPEATRAVRGAAEDIPLNAAPEQATPTAQPIKQNWFANLFGDQGVGISAFGSNKGKAVSSGDVIVKKSIREDKGNVLDDVTAGYRATHQALVDRLDPLKHGGQNVYESAIDTSRANQIANQILGKEFVTPEGKVIGEGMESLFKSIPRGQDKTFMDYLIVKDAQARVPRGERVYDANLKVPDPSDTTKHIELNSEAGLAARRASLEQRYPWLPQMSERWNAFTNNLRQSYGVNEGLLSQDMSDALVQARPDYIKMLRQFSRSEKPGRSLLGRSAADTFTGLKAPIKRVSPSGSARNIVDPRKTMSESVGAWVNNAMRNRVGQELVNNILNDSKSFEGIARIVPETAEAMKKSLDEINEILQREGIDGLAEKMNKDYEIAFKKGSQAGGKDNLISVMMNGNPVKVEILNPEMALAFQGMNPTQLGLVMQIAKFGSDFVKRSATGVLAPAFAAKSAIVDLPVALIQAKGNRLRFLGDYTHALASGLANKLKIPRLSELAREFERAGGGYSSSMKGEKALNKAVKNLERNPILSGKNLLRTGENVLKAPFRITEEFSNVFENAPRIAAAKGELRRLGGEKTKENVRKAMQEGREITVNYSRRGRLTNELEALSPYTNAAIQGVSRLGRQIAKKPLQTIAGVTAVVGLPKVYEYMQFHDDPDYQRLPAREKFRNLIVSKNEDGTFAKVPLEPSYAAFGAAALDFFQYVKDNDPNAFKGMSDSLANAYLPPLASGALQGLTQGAEGNKSAIEKSGWGLANATSFGPAIGTIANQSFTGAPIDSAAVADRSPQYRYDERTSSIAKYIGDKLNFSPMKTDYLMRQYGGDLARIGLPALSDVGSGTQKQTLLRNFIVDPVFTNNLSNDYYTGKSLIDAAYRDNQEVEAPLPKWYTEELRKYISSSAKGSISKQLSELSGEKKTVQADRLLSAEGKATKLREIQRKINTIYIDVNSRLEKAGVPLPRR